MGEGELRFRESVKLLHMSGKRYHLTVPKIPNYLCCAVKLAVVFIYKITPFAPAVIWCCDTLVAPK